MSHVSNWLLVANDEAVCQVNKKLNELDREDKRIYFYGEGFRTVPSEQGGTKLMEVDIHLAAFNYVNHEELIGVIKDILLHDYLHDWQLMVLDQDDIHFKIVFQSEEG